MRNSTNNFDFIEISSQQVNALLGWRFCLIRQLGSATGFPRKEISVPQDDVRRKRMGRADRELGRQNEASQSKRWSDLATCPRQAC